MEKSRFTSLFYLPVYSFFKKNLESSAIHLDWPDKNTDKKCSYDKKGILLTWQKKPDLDKKCKAFFVSKSLTLTKNVKHFLFQKLRIFCKAFFVSSFWNTDKTLTKIIFKTKNAKHFLSGFCQVRFQFLLLQLWQK